MSEVRGTETTEQGVLGANPTDTTTFGYTTLGTPLRVEWRGDIGAGLRILVVAGQHGDERGGMEAARRVLERDARDLLEKRGVRLGIVCEANPDGATRGHRLNPDGLDLNRDHMALRSPEVAAIHRLIRSSRPHVVLDVHTYPSRRRHLLRRGWILDDDVLIATPTHPAACSRLPFEFRSQFVWDVVAELERAGVRAGEYRVFQKSGRTRRSTLATVDLRNGVALRYGVPAVLLEGRAPRTDDTKVDRERLIEAQRRAVTLVVEWFACHPAAYAQRGSVVPIAGDPVAIGVRWKVSNDRLTATIRDVDTKTRRPVELLDVAGEAEVTCSVRLPWAYAVPEESVRLLQWLNRQGFESFLPAPAARWKVEAIGHGNLSCRGTDEAPSGSQPTMSVESTGPLDGFRLLPVSQKGGNALAVWLEADSSFGWVGNPGVDLDTASGERYAVRRIYPMMELNP